MISSQFKIGVVLLFILGLLAISPISLLLIWVFTSPFITNFISMPIFYSFLASRMEWDYSSNAYLGFRVEELFQYDRIVLIVLFLTIIVSKRYSILKVNRIDYLLYLLLLIFFFSSLFSINILNSIRTIIDTFGLCYLSYFIGKNLIDGEKQFNSFVNAVLLLGCILIAVGLFEWRIRGTYQDYRITGPFAYWESMALVLAIIILVILYKLSTISSIFSIIKVFLVSLVILACLCILLTQTRTAMIALIIGVFMGLYKGRHIIKKRTIIGVVVFSSILAIIIAVYPMLITNTDYYQHTIKRETSESRKEQYAVAYRMFAANPISGIGFKNYRDKFSDYVKVKELKYSRADYTTLHNSYFVIASENGLIGVLPMLLLVLSAFQLCNNYYTIEDNKNGKLWGVTMIAISTVYFVSASSFDMFFLVSIENKLYYLCLGITTGRYQRLLSKSYNQKM